MTAAHWPQRGKEGMDALAVVRHLCWRGPVLSFPTRPPWAAVLSSPVSRAELRLGCLAGLSQLLPAWGPDVWLLPSPPTSTCSYPGPRCPDGTRVSVLWPKPLFSQEPPSVREGRIAPPSRRSSAALSAPHPFPTSSNYKLWAFVMSHYICLCWPLTSSAGAGFGALP